MSTGTVRVLNHQPAAVWVEELRGAGYVVDVRPLRTPADLKAIGRVSGSRPGAVPPTGERLGWRPQPWV